MSAGTGDSSTASSAPLTSDAPGYWCIQSTYTGDSNYAVASDTSTDGCFDVTPTPCRSRRRRSPTPQRDSPTRRRWQRPGARPRTMEGHLRESSRRAHVEQQLRDDLRHDVFPRRELQLQGQGEGQHRPHAREGKGLVHHHRDVTRSGTPCWPASVPPRDSRRSRSARPLPTGSGRRSTSPAQVFANGQPCHAALNVVGGTPGTMSPWLRVPVQSG